MEQVRIFPTGQFQNHRRPVDRFLTGQSTDFFTESFCSLLNVSDEKFSKGGGRGMGEVLKFVTLDGDLRKKRKKILRFLQK